MFFNMPGCLVSAGAAVATNVAVGAATALATCATTAGAGALWSSAFSALPSIISGRQRLAQEVGHAGCLGPFFMCRIAVTGHDHDRRPWLSRLDALGDFQAVHAGHPDIGEDDVVLFLLQLHQCVVAVLGGDHDIALVRKDSAEALADHRVVIDD